MKREDDAPMQTLIIVGTGLAGYNLAREWRKRAPQDRLIMISRDAGHSYSKPLLSTAFAKGKGAEDLVMARREAMAGQLAAEILTAELRHIDTAARQIELADGQRLAYDHLVLALGADPFRPPLAGNGAASVLSVNDLEDYARLRAALQGRRKVLILGGGLIGCEFANDLLQGGFSVDLVEPAGRLLPALLPAAAASALAQALTDAGVRLHLHAEGWAVAVHHLDQGLRVEFRDGSHLDTEVVVSAIGLRPRIALAQAAGLSCARGIRVDRYLRTSAAHVYALGDCAEVEGLLLPYVLPLMAQARALAQTLSAMSTPVHYPAMPVQVKTSVCPVVVAPVAADSVGEWSVAGQGQDLRLLFHDSSGQLRGFVLLGQAAGQAADKAALQKQLPNLLPVESEHE